ncbi:hypothetical protein YTPLAS18_33150 [Nitrospira sp.]|nr:hypothetical protein YTPLAS18_33150 [Nitrospira sp.]
MPETGYSHAGLGFGFEVPQGWTLDLDSANPRFPVIISMRSNTERIMVAIRATLTVNSAERATSMKDELAARGIDAKPVAAALSFPGTGNVATVEFQIGGQQQQWISMVTNGVEFSFTHTGSYEIVRKGLEHIAATFRMPQAEQARQFLIARAPQSPQARAEDLERMSHFQRVAARFNVPPAKRPGKRSE